MGIRINKDSEVDELGHLLGDRITQQDVFVINAEYPGSKPSDWEAVLQRLDEKFPCNRVVTLTGLGRRPDSPSFEYALVGRPELDAVLVDWEPDSWADTGRGAWPNPKASEPVERIGPDRAAACTAQILGADGAGVLYWASPESIRAMLDTPLGSTLRQHLASAERAYSGSS